MSRLVVGGGFYCGGWQRPWRRPCALRAYLLQPHNLSLSPTHPATTIALPVAVAWSRCDYLDPYLPWGGVKDTGKGVSLSVHGFRSVVRLKGECCNSPRLEKSRRGIG